jgi:arginine-tRNA-protein transferase
MEAQEIKNDLEQYFVESSIDCPYGLSYQALYHQALFDTLPDVLMEKYLSSGYRRNGNILYNMHCRECSNCVPIRIIPDDFTPNRNQRRTWQKNNDVEVEIGPLQCSAQNLTVLQKFLADRYPERQGSAMEYYNGFFINHICNTYEFRYSIDGKLMGVAIADLSHAWLNIVFFYFDPEFSKRSPGTYNILFLIDFCRRQEIKFIYLGYWIDKVRSMRYKAYFKPHYLLQNNTWNLIQK